MARIADFDFIEFDDQDSYLDLSGNSEDKNDSILEKEESSEDKKPN